ncbi:MAG: DUF3667 domain-containing protein [Robiginitomaculum sp.]|nr:DUF3667 domain-containing protein [Robiginitomaculum sp.]
MEEEIITGVAVEAAVVAGLVPDVDNARTNDHKSEFRSPTELDECSSCHTPLNGRFCHVCGQVADTFHRPVWSLFSDIFDGLFGLDGRIWHTVLPLMLRPGEVTHDYLSGVRKPYIQPFKLFLAASILFFLVFELSTRDHTGRLQVGTDGVLFGGQNIDAEDKEQALRELESVKGQLAESIPGVGGKQVQDILNSITERVEEAPVTPEETTTEPRGITVNGGTFICAVRQWLVPEDVTTACRTSLDTAKENLNLEPGETGKLKAEARAGTKVSVNLPDNETSPVLLNLEARQFLADNLETAIRDPDRYMATVGRWAPRLVFVLAPVYGLVLALSFFWRRKLYIYDHMIVALHFHSFLFLFLALMIPLGLLTTAVIPSMIFLVWSNYYLYRLHRKIYGCNRFTAVLRTMVLDLTYLVVLSGALMLLMVLGVLFL